MALIGRVLRIAVVGLLVLVVACGTFLGWVIVRGFPERSGTARLPGLSANVTVLRDQYGIAQIYADTPEDLFAAQGYVHAQERMWQMEVWRHISGGRLAELFGESQVGTDKFIRTLGWRQAAQRDYDAAPPAMKAILAAYARGVNGWLAAHHDLGLPFVVTGLLGAGGGLSGYQPSPWDPVDTMAWAKVQAWQLGGNFGSEIFNLLLARKVDAKAVAELSPPYAAEMPVIVPSGAPGSGGAGATGRTPAAGSPDPQVLAAVGDPTDLLALGALAGSIARPASGGPQDPLHRSEGVGSNDWVVSGRHSASGHALLHNDPHLDHSMPSLWYMVGLHCRQLTNACPYDVAGVSFPGGPGVVLGHNDRIAWGFTNVDPDVEDLFVEKLDPADPSRYQYLGQMRPLDTRQETVKVKGAPDVTITVRSTVHGPLISDLVDDLKPSGQGGSGLANDGSVAYALRWTAIAEVDRTAESILALDRARDFSSFRDALRLFGAPSQNVVYADVDGHIGYQMPGRIPIRKAGDGSTPVPGWDGSHDWTGYVSFDALPYLYDPPSGIIATANNAVVDGRYPYLIGREWDPGYRSRRILDLLAKSALTLDAMATIALDSQMGIAADVVPRLGSPAPSTEDGKLVLQRIQAWAAETATGIPYGCNAVDEVSDQGCAAFNAFLYHLARDVFDPRLGGGTARDDIARLYVGSGASASAIVHFLQDPASRWWDDPSTTLRETTAQVVAKALDQAGADLRASLGDPADWTWQTLHTVRFEEQTLGKSGIAPLEAAFDQGPYPIGGSVFAVNQQYYGLWRGYPDPYASDPAASTTSFADLFRVAGGPSYRLDVDLGSLDTARIVTTTGQSGVPFDEHYGDLIPVYLRGEQVTLPFTRSAVDAATRQTLTLTP